MQAGSRALPLRLSLLALMASACHASDEPLPLPDAAPRDVDVQPAAPDRPLDAPAQAAGDAGDAGADALNAPGVSTQRPDMDAGPGLAADSASSTALDAAPDATGAPDAASDTALSSPAIDDSGLCPDGFPKGDASLTLTRIATFTPSPEGVTTCPNGDVFVTVDGPDEIQRVPLDGGTPQRYASLRGFQPAGIDCDERGRLFVAGFSRRDGSPNPPILMVEGPGATPVSLPLPPNTSVNGLNGIAVVKGAGVFASDTGGGVLLRARELPDGGFETTVAANDVLGANGLMYAPRTRSLYLVTSFLPTRVLSFPVGADGTLGQPKEEAYGGLLRFYDGVAVDAAGTLYVADYQQRAVRRARDQSLVATLEHPASFAFRGGSLLVTSYHLNDVTAEGGLYAVQLGSCGPGR